MLCANDTPLFDLSDNATRLFLTALEIFQRAYSPVHGFICIVICTFSIATNLIHVLVLTRPNMRCCAVNCVLTAVAICDMGTMASYLIYICHFVLFKDTACVPIYSYLWMRYLLCHMVLSIALHTTSLWLIVAMAFIRQMTLRNTVLNSSWQRPQLAWRVCISIYICVLVLCMPTLLVYDVVEIGDWRPAPHCAHNFPPNYTAKYYTFHVSPSAMANGCRFFKWNLWMSGIIFKVIPCISLLYFSSGLMLKLHRTTRKRKMLLKKSAVKTRWDIIKPDRTSGLLLAIVLVFLMAEMPQGIIAIMNAIYTTHVHIYIYFNLGDILDLLSLLNSSITFVLYCLMSSRQFIGKEGSEMLALGAQSMQKPARQAISNKLVNYNSVDLLDQPSDYAGYT
uniref:G-protein coupled receptors family 1 profile domain-containing protein n=1 Tax=Setaria digitata TaxID=48799 RepID=A0A915Q100_9BILA